jgi:hypothetical protein
MLPTSAVWGKQLSQLALSEVRLGSVAAVLPASAVWGKIWLDMEIWILKSRFDWIWLDLDFKSGDQIQYFELALSEVSFFLR